MAHVSQRSSGQGSRGRRSRKNARIRDRIEHWGGLNYPLPGYRQYMARGYSASTCFLCVFERSFRSGTGALERGCPVSAPSSGGALEVSRLSDWTLCSPGRHRAARRGDHSVLLDTSSRASMGQAGRSWSSSVSLAQASASDLLNVFPESYRQNPLPTSWGASRLVMSLAS